MPMSNIRSRIAVIVPAIAALLIAGPADAQNFPAAGTDTTTSLGRFKIQVAPAFQAAVAAAFPAYYNAGVFTSPLLSDSNTSINRSDPIKDGSAADINGVQVGSIMVKDSDFTSVPAAFINANGYDEVHTQIASVDLTGSGFAVRMGAAGDPGLPNSIGEVQAKSAASDFPARSFFDIFVDVDVPGLGTLSNTDPLVVQNPNLTAFPPKVIYVHDQSSQVGIYFDADIPALGIQKGDLFGNLILAGHGVGYDPSNPNDVNAFNNAFNNNFVPEASTTVSMVFLFGIGGLSVLRHRRKRAVA